MRIAEASVTSWISAVTLGCCSVVAFCFRDTNAKKVDKAGKTGNIFFVRWRRVGVDCFGVFVVGPQACLGDVEAKEVEVLLVELGLPHVEGEPCKVEPVEDVLQVVVVLVLVNRADQKVLPLFYPLVSEMWLLHFLRLNGIKLNWKVPKGVTTAVFA